MQCKSSSWFWEKKKKNGKIFADTFENRNPSGAVHSAHIFSDWMKFLKATDDSLYKIRAPDKKE